MCSCPVYACLLDFHSALCFGLFATRSVCQVLNSFLDFNCEIVYRILLLFFIMSLRSHFYSEFMHIINELYVVH